LKKDNVVIGKCKGAEIYAEIGGARGQDAKTNVWCVKILEKTAYMADSANGLDPIRSAAGK
jgi:hypothetical protein